MPFGGLCVPAQVNRAGWHWHTGCLFNRCCRTTMVRELKCSLKTEQISPGAGRLPSSSSPRLPAPLPLPEPAGFPSLLSPPVGSPF
jgi:hypothetical protein